MVLINDYVLVAQAVTTDTNDHTVSIFKIIDGMTFGIKKTEFKKAFNADPGSVTVPMAASYVVASSWSTPKKLEEDQTYSIKAILNAPDGEELNQILQEVTMPKGTDKMRFNFNIQGIPIKNSGKYTFTIQILDDGKVIAEGNCFVNVELNVQD